jgi:hypothetical protein
MLVYMGVLRCNQRPGVDWLCVRGGDNLFRCFGLAGFLFMTRRPSNSNTEQSVLREGPLRRRRSSCVCVQFIPLKGAKVVFLTQCHACVVVKGGQGATKLEASMARF